MSHDPGTAAVPSASAPLFRDDNESAPVVRRLDGSVRKPRKVRQGRKYDRRETRAGWAFLSPWIIGLLVFTLGPMIYSLVLSFTNNTLGKETKFVGFKQYQTMFSDNRVSTALYNTFIYAVLYVPLAIVIALGLAMLLNKLSHGAGFFRTLYYLPVMTPGVAVAVLFSLLLNGNYGLVNRFLALFHLQGPQWLTDPNWIKPSIVLMTLWSLGGSIVIFLAALKNVPTDLYEAASLDGAGPWRRFRSITVPMISSALFFQVIVLTIYAMQMFDKVFVLFGNQGTAQNGGNASLFYTLYLFRQAFQNFKFGYASALAWLLFLIIAAITFLQVKVGNRFVYYENDRQ